MENNSYFPDSVQTFPSVHNDSFIARQTSHLYDNNIECCQYIDNNV